MKTALQLVEELAASRAKEIEALQIKSEQEYEAAKQKRKDFWAPVCRVVDEIHSAHPEATSEVKFADPTSPPWFCCCSTVFKLVPLKDRVRIQSGHYATVCEETTVDALIPFVISTLANALRVSKEKK